VSPHWLAATTAIELTSDYLLRKSIGLNFSIDHLRASCNPLRCC
jgi:hypothetical protein